MLESRMTKLFPVLLAVAGCAIACSVQAQIAVRNQGYMPYSDAPINYRADDVADPVAKLEHQIENGETSLTWDSDQGYLKSVLKLLKVPLESQTLVFSKTSFQYPKITPDHPRALYYNDDVYVGKVHDGKAIELVSFDARQGAIFYLLDEHKVDKPVFQRAELDCTQCHIAAGTRGIPGVLVRSVYAANTGTLVPGAPSFITDQDSPIAERWGGWYVTGKVATGSMANAIADVPADAPVQVAQSDASGPKLAPLAAQTYNASDYLTAGSDAVALLVLGHQTQMHNLITLTNYKTRIALYALQSQSASGNAAGPADGSALPEATRRQFERPAEQLLRYLLFANEAPLTDLHAQAALQASPFAREFAGRGPRDSKGRSLRDFDLGTHIFRYPCSYLIYSDAFDALPQPAKGYVYHRLLQILSGDDKSEDFARLSAEDRRAVLEILLETKPDLPEEWHNYAHSNHLKLADSVANTSSGRAG
jgi:hypothetical protein